jgi:hypothetical protein
MLVLDNLAEAPSQRSEHFASRTDRGNVTGMASATPEHIIIVPPSLREEMLRNLAFCAAKIRDIEC